MMDNMQNCSNNGPGRVVLLQNCSKDARTIGNARKCIRRVHAKALRNPVEILLLICGFMMLDYRLLAFSLVQYYIVCIAQPFARAAAMNLVPHR